MYLFTRNIRNKKVIIFTQGTCLQERLSLRTDFNHVNGTCMQDNNVQCTLILISDIMYL